MADRTISSIEKDYENYLFKFGAGTVGTSLTTIADNGVTDTAFLSTPDKATIVSGSVEDKSGGGGATSINISGLDADLLQISENLILNGTTAVDTINIYSVIFRMKVITTEDSSAFTGPNHGAITAKDKTTGAIVMAEIGEFNGQTLMALWQCPSNKWASLLDLDIYSPAAKITTFQFLYQDLGTDSWNILIKTFGAYSQTEKFFKKPQLIKPGTKLMAVANVATGTSVVSCTFEAELFDLDQGVS